MRLKEDQNSWQADGIKRRMYRQAPLTPEEETTRHKSMRRKKVKHVHDWKDTVIGRKTMRGHRRKGDGTFESFEYETDKVQYVCTRCGNKRGYYHYGW